MSNAGPSKSEIETVFNRLRSQVTNKVVFSFIITFLIYNEGINVQSFQLILLLLFRVVLTVMRKILHGRQ